MTPDVPASVPTMAPSSKAFMVMGNMKLTVGDATSFAERGATAASIARTIGVLLPGIEASTVTVNLFTADNASVNLTYRVVVGSAGTATAANRAIAGWRGHDLLCSMNEGLASAAGHVILAIEAKKPSRDLAGSSRELAISDEAPCSCICEGIGGFERAILALSRTVDNKWTKACYGEALRAARDRRLRYLGRAGQ